MACRRAANPFSRDDSHGFAQGVTQAKSASGRPVAALFRKGAALSTKIIFGTQCCRILYVADSQLRARSLFTPVQVYANLT